jgi:hypothetical protein
MKVPEVFLFIHMVVHMLICLVTTNKSAPADISVENKLHQQINQLLQNSIFD